jgi:hypothetical protein
MEASRDRGNPASDQKRAELYSKENSAWGSEGNLCKLPIAERHGSGDF